MLVSIASAVLQHHTRTFFISYTEVEIQINKELVITKNTG